jgi:hypothetical protein
MDLAAPYPACSVVSRAPPDGLGWKAEIGDDQRDDDPSEVVMFCPDCWEREFGR